MKKGKRVLRGIKAEQDVVARSMEALGRGTMNISFSN
jgi:hypothetical protein